MVFSFPGFELDYVVLDWMHIADLGVSLYMLGNCMWYLFKIKMKGKHTNLVSSNDTCAGIIIFLEMAVKNLQPMDKSPEPPINKLTLTMFRPQMKNAPKLKVKAAECRAIIPCVLWIFENISPPTCPSDQVHVTHDGCL